MINARPIAQPGIPVDPPVAATVELPWQDPSDASLCPKDKSGSTLPYS